MIYGLDENHPCNTHFFKFPYRDAANGRLDKLEMLHDPANRYRSTGWLEEDVVGVIRCEVVGAGCPRSQEEQECGLQGRVSVVENASG